MPYSGFSREEGLHRFMLPAKSAAQLQAQGPSQLKHKQLLFHLWQEPCGCQHSPNTEIILGQEGTWAGNQGGTPHFGQAPMPFIQKEVQLGAHTPCLSRSRSQYHSATFAWSRSACSAEGDQFTASVAPQPLHHPRRG